MSTDYHAQQKRHAKALQQLEQELTDEAAKLVKTRDAKEARIAEIDAEREEKHKRVEKPWAMQATSDKKTSLQERMCKSHYGYHNIGP